MSYDVSLLAGESGESEVFSRNHTSNTSRMWKAAGTDLREFHGKRAEELAESLERTILAIQDDPERFRAMDAPNGWGDYDSTRAFLWAVFDACREWPDATVEVSS